MRLIFRILPCFFAIVIDAMGFGALCMAIGTAVLHKRCIHH